jgi:hypothetical protein
MRARACTRLQANEANDNLEDEMLNNDAHFVLKVRTMPAEARRHHRTAGRAHVWPGGRVPHSTALRACGPGQACRKFIRLLNVYFGLRGSDVMSRHFRADKSGQIEATH